MAKPRPTPTPDARHVSLVAIPDALAASLVGMHDVLNAFTLMDPTGTGLGRQRPFDVEIVGERDTPSQAPRFGGPDRIQQRIDGGVQSTYED